MRKTQLLRAAAATLAVAVVAGCVSVPSQRLVKGVGYSAPALDGRAITLVSWNIAKEKTTQWALSREGADIRARLIAADLLLLQEACGGAADLAPLLGANDYGWALAASFESASLGCGSDIATGVLTASRAGPLTVTALRSRRREFGITPKTALATMFALRERPDRLLVVNAHLLNFEWFDLDDFDAQLQRIGTLIAAHDGPVILAGDLNTRNGQRLGLVRQLAAQYDLRPVFGEKPNGRTQAPFGGGFALDHIFYRGLTVAVPGRIGREAQAGFSNHNSLTATFALPKIRAGRQRSAIDADEPMAPIAPGLPR